MKILIFGGTKFVGLHAAQEALSRGHTVTVLNRGSHKPPKGALEVIGDRLAPDGLANLADQHFDAVIDTWMDDASVVKNAVDFLRGRIGQYIYVSSISVYDFDKGTKPYTEKDCPLHDPDTTDVKYFKDKVLGEREADKAGEGVAVLKVRPGVILGPDEGLPGRLPWWLRRMERGGPTLAPGPKDLSMSFIDVRDLARFMIDGAEKKLAGEFSIVAPIGHMTYGSFVETANEVVYSTSTSNSNNNTKPDGKENEDDKPKPVELYWLEPADKVLEAGIQPWVEFPIWLPPGEDELYYVDEGKAVREGGLKTRSMRETVEDTWAWLRHPESEFQKGGKVGLGREKEEKILKEYFGK